MSFSHSLCGVPIRVPLNTESEKLQRRGQIQPGHQVDYQGDVPRCCDYGSQTHWAPRIARENLPMPPRWAVKELANPCSLQLHTDHISAVWLSLFVLLCSIHSSFLGKTPVVGRKTMRWVCLKANRHTISLLHQATSTVFLTTDGWSGFWIPHAFWKQQWLHGSSVF